MPENETTEEQASKGIGERFREEGFAGVFRKRSASNKTDPNEMHFLEHLEELRWVIFKSLIAFIVGCIGVAVFMGCLLYTSPSPRDATLSRMPSSA